MPKSHTLAKYVVTYPNAFPEVIVTAAATLYKMQNKKREAIKKLWSEYRQIRQEFRVKYKVCFADAKIRNVSGYGARKAMATKQTLRELNQTYTHTHNYGAEFYETWMISKENKHDIFYFQHMLINMLKILHCRDIELMYQYISCANAERINDDVESVQFIHYIPANKVAEIMTWRLLHESRHKTKHS